MVSSQNYGPFVGYRLYYGTSYLGVPQFWELPIWGLEGNYNLDPKNLNPGALN